MKHLAEADGDIFLPNPEPSVPVENIFICMEPSLGRWARSPDEARAKVEAGFRNFVSSVEDFILHYCASEYLLGTYHVTDFSKGAMLVERAGVGRVERYDRWYGLLAEEIDLVATPGASIFAVGGAVARQLARRDFPRPFHSIIHYSGLAARVRSQSIVGHEEDFEQFKGSVSLEHILLVAKDVLTASVSKRFAEQTLARLASSDLSESRQKLIFSYKLAFDRVSKQ